MRRDNYPGWARTTTFRYGEAVLLPDQDRSWWDYAQIEPRQHRNRGETNEVVGLGVLKVVARL